LPFAVVGVQVVLLATGIIDLARAVIIVLTLELALITVVIAELAALRAAFLRARKSGATRGRAASEALDAALPRPVAFMIRQEFQVFGALVLLARGRAGNGDRVALGYAREVRVMVWVLVVISVSGALAAGLFLTLAWLRWLLVVLGCYWALWAIGYGVLMARNPHLLDPRELRLQLGASRDFSIPTSAIRGVRVDERRGVRQTGQVSDGELTIALFGRTNLLLELEDGVAVEIGGEPRSVHRVRFLVDQPEPAAILLKEAAKRARLEIRDADPGATPTAGRGVEERADQ
jgi:hypothetical protein